MARGWAIEPKGDYPPEWVSGEVQQALYALADWRCEHCGCEFIPGTTKAKTARNRDGKPRILTVHHLDGNKANCCWQNLIVACQTCHLQIQATWSPGDYLPLSWDGVPAWLTARGLPYMKHPQMSMFTTAQGGE